MHDEDAKLADKLIDTVTEQPEAIRVGGRIYDLQPRSLKQLRAIAKHITSYRTKLYDDVKNAEVAKADAFESAMESVNSMPFDVIIEVVQMFYDKRKVFKLESATMKKKLLEEELDYVEVKKLLTKAIELHDIGDLLKKVDGLRAI